MAEESVEVADVVTSGAFESSLKRNNRQIKSDRATAIAEDTQLAYKRVVEDLTISVRRMKREQENMLDLSPENATSLRLANEFNSEAFVTKDHDLGVKIRTEEIRLEVAKQRYTYLFGEMN